MEIIENSFHINGLKINQRTLCVHVCSSAHGNIYTYVDYPHVCIYVYIYTCTKNVHTHIYVKCVCVFIEETDTIFIAKKDIQRIPS